MENLENICNILREICGLDDEISSTIDPESEDDRNNIRRYHSLVESLPSTISREDLIDIYREVIAPYALIKELKEQLGYTKESISHLISEIETI